MKKTIAILTIIASVSAFIPNAANATPSKSNKSKTNTANNAGGLVTVTNLGDKDEFVFLQIDLQQSNPGLSVLRILDVNGVGLHSETFSTKSFRRLIKVSPEEFNGIEIVLATNEGVTRKRYDLNTVLFKATQLVESNK
ncbi:MAG: hypothetical protein EAY75_13130 [Bacteroidetes bacterium]|nr:MAG: hypothetical protein EAY75_13130 [Bacteroidota bacterium]